MKNIILALHILAFGSMPLLAQPVISQQPTNQVVPMGSSASVGITATGDNLNYQWFKDGVRLMNQTNSTINFASFQFTNSGSYSVMASNSYGIAISLTTLLGAPNAPLKAWGYMGNGTTNGPALIPPATVTSNVVAITAGNQHSLFVKADGTLWSMGRNAYGQLGDGTTNDSD